MDSGGEGSEVVTSVIRYTTQKTVTINHDRLPIFILFYFTTFLIHTSPLLREQFDLPMDHTTQTFAVLSQFSGSVLRIWIQMQRKSIKTDEHICSARDLSTSMVAQNIIPSKAQDRSFELFIGQWYTWGRIETYIWKCIFSVFACFLVFLYCRKTKVKKLKLRKPKKTYSEKAILKRN